MSEGKGCFEWSSEACKYNFRWVRLCSQGVLDRDDDNHNGDYDDGCVKEEVVRDAKVQRPSCGVPQMFASYV